MRWRSRANLLYLWIWFAFLSTCLPSAGYPQDNPYDRVIQGILEGPIQFRCSLEAGDFLEVITKSDEVIYRLQEQTGELLLATEGSDTRRLFFIAPERATLVLSLLGPAGSAYRLEIKRPRPANERAHQLIKAQDDLKQARELSKQFASWDRAQVLFERAHTLWQEQGETTMAAITLAEWGIAERKHKQNWDAVDHLEKAIARLDLMQEPHLAATCRMWLANCYRALGYHHRGLTLTESVVVHARDHEDSLLLGSALNDLARMRQRLGYYHQTLALFEEANQIWTDLGRTNYLTTGLTNLGEYLSHLGLYELARDYFLKAMTQARPAGDSIVLADLYLYLGWNAYRQQQFKDAHADLQQALNLYQQNQNIYRQIIARERLAILLDAQGHLEAAQTHLDQAINLVEDKESPLDKANLSATMGLFALKRKQYATAIQLGKDVFSVGKKLGNQPLQRNGLYLQAQAMAALNQPLEARALLAPIVDHVESERQTLTGITLRGTFRADRHEFYDLYLQLCMELHQKHPQSGYEREALSLIERIRGRGLLEGMARTENNDMSLVQNLSELQHQISLKESERLQLSKQQREGIKGQQLAKELRALMMDYDRTRYALVSPSMQPTGSILHEPIKHYALEKDSLLLVYALTEQQSYLWVVDGSNVQAFLLPSQKEIRSLAWKYYRYVSDYPVRLREQARKKAERELANVLLEPLSKLNLEGKKRLVFMNDDILHRVPFAALRMPGQSKRLVDQFELSTIPSMRIMQKREALLSQRSKAKKEIFILADPVFGANDPRLAGKTSNGSSTNRILDLTRLERLPETEAEAHFIEKVFVGKPQKTVQGFTANLAEMASWRLQDYRILHFATHALPNAKHPELAGLVTTLVDQEGKPTHGFFHTHAIENLALTAELVVLSACQTAGTPLEGEGLVGLSHGFLKAGARAVLVSLWNIDDAATRHLMTAFYEAMVREGDPPAEALRKAQRSMASIDTYQSPYFWAGFALLGESPTK